MKLKPVDEVVEKIYLAVNSKPTATHDELIELITQDRNQQKTDLLEMVEGMKIYEKGYIKFDGGREMEVDSDRCLIHNQAIEDIEEKINNYYKGVWET